MLLKERIKTAQRVQSVTGYALQVWRRGGGDGVSRIAREASSRVLLS